MDGQGKGLNGPALLKEYRRIGLTVNVLDELVALYLYWETGDQEYLRKWMFLRLVRERNKYQERGIPEDSWPTMLQGDDWEERLLKDGGSEGSDEE